MKKIAVLNSEQSALVAELVELYGIDPEGIMFFEEEPKKPFFSYEANSVLCNFLTNLAQIGVEPVPSSFADSVSVKCSITLANGHERSAVGVANLAEKVDDDRDISEQQAINLASSRALRSVLRAAGIDLLKLHEQTKTGEVLQFNIKSNFASLLGQVHQLGKEKQLIVGENKFLWYHELWSRYRVNRSNELTEEQLADFVAFLRAYEPPVSLAA